MTDPNTIQPGGVTPYLTIPSGGGQAAVEFYRAAFGAEEQFHTLAEDGERLMHSRLVVNGGIVMLSDEFPEHGHKADQEPTAVTLHLQVDDADFWWERALKAGCVPVMPLADQFWGDRYGRVTDPFGHCWSIGAPILRGGG